MARKKWSEEEYWLGVLARIEKSPNCWLWKGKVNHDGYGETKYFNRSYVRVHRLVYEKLVGPIPHGMLVCHSCDNPPCVNPAHLWLGTPADNSADMSKKGRASKGNPNFRPIPMVGVENPSSKLTENQVRDIKRMYANGGWTHRGLGKKFGVSNIAIQKILSGKAWTHVN